MPARTLFTSVHLPQRKAALAISHQNGKDVQKNDEFANGKGVFANEFADEVAALQSSATKHQLPICSNF